MTASRSASITAVTDLTVLQELSLRLVPRAVAIGIDVHHAMLVLGPQLVDELAVIGPFLVEQDESGRPPPRTAIRRASRSSPSSSTVGADPEAADDERQGQALADERGQDHAERAGR